MTEGGEGFTSKQRKKYISENYEQHIEKMKKLGLLDMKGEKNPFFYGKKHSKENLKRSVNNRRKK